MKPVRQRCPECKDPAARGIHRRCSKRPEARKRWVRDQELMAKALAVASVSPSA